MKIAIIGSRPEWDPRRGEPRGECPEDDRDMARCRAIFLFVEALPANTLIVSGGAPGADTWAREAAEAYGLQCVIFPAAWKRRDRTTNYGAGKRRNALIADYADCVAAFYGAGKSDGTDHCVTCFERLRKPFETRDWTGALIERERA